MSRTIRSITPARPRRPQGYASGSFGPTTAGRMDSYVDAFMAAGGSFVTLAKGNRGAEVRDACRKHGGFYLGSIGGPAARLALDCIRKVESARISRARHGSGLAHRGGGFSRLHRHRRQGQRFFCRAQLERAAAPAHGCGASRLAPDELLDRARSRGEKGAWEAFVRRYAGLVVAAVRGVAREAPRSRI